MRFMRTVGVLALVAAALPGHTQRVTTATSSGIQPATGALPAAPLAGATKELGEIAPELQISTWINGQGVTLAAGRGEKIYVLDFWATWCQPCVISIPHLQKLQEKYRDKGIVFIGITDEPEAAVRPFVQKQGERMDYLVAIDDARRTGAEYMDAFGARGLPYAFIVDREGRVAWHGHPMGALSRTLDQVIAGTYDTEKAKRAAKAPQKVRRYFQLVQERSPEAKAVGEMVLELASEEPALLAEFGMRIVSSSDIPDPDRELALRALKKACEATEYENAQMLHYYAHGLFTTGDREKALTYQKMAVEKNQDKGREDLLKTALERYGKAVEQGTQ